MNSNFENLRIVTMNSPYDHWHMPQVQNLFSQIVGLKIAGYQKEYPYGVLPIDTTDFIGAHHMVCDDRAGDLVPLMGYKSITADKCRTHRIDFPLLGALRASTANDHIKAAEDILTACARDSKDISYDSSWTIHPEVRANEVLTAKLRDIMKAIHVLYHLESNIPEILAGGVNRFKMERLYHYWGYHELNHNGVPLPSITNPILFNESVTIYHLTNFSEKAILDAEKYRNMWEERLSLEMTRPLDVLSRAA